jgi:hypothetical protein
MNTAGARRSLDFATDNIIVFNFIEFLFLEISFCLHFLALV